MLLERSDLRILDTRAMEWSEHPLIPGVRTKVLSRDAGGDPAVSLLWYPPGAPRGDPTAAERRLHRSVREQLLVLAGEQPTWEYRAADGLADVVELKEGYFVDRSPGAVHGFEPGPVSAVGCVFLVIQDGPGIHVGEAGYEAETATLPQQT